MSNKTGEEEKGGPEPGKKNRGIASRRLALEVLIKTDTEHSFVNPTLHKAFKQKQLSERDRAFVTALVLGVLRHRTTLDLRIAKVSRQSLEKMPSGLRNILRMAIFQFEFMPDIPVSAVVDTSTTLARAVGHEGSAKFANGVLRAYLRQTTTKSAVDEAASTSLIDGATQDDQAVVDNLAVQFSLPHWLVKRWLSNFGQEETLALAQFSQSKPSLTVRAVETAISTEGLQTIFQSKGIECHRGDLVKTCLIIDRKQAGSPQRLPGFDDGLFLVQDEAAAFVSLVIDPKPGETVVDLCAAPGGKTLHLAELMQNSGRVIAVDKSTSRLKLLKENRARLGFTNIEIVAGDGRELKLNTPVQKLLLDAPCTGTGVINRRSDLRFNRTESDILALAELQRQLLANAATLLQPGGILVYATCSIEPEENFENIRWFLREFQNYRGDDLSVYVPERKRTELCSAWEGPACKTEEEMTTPYMWQLLPTRQGVSGFFVSRLRRVE